MGNVLAGGIDHGGEVWRGFGDANHAEPIWVGAGEVEVNIIHGVEFHLIGVHQTLAVDVSAHTALLRP